MLLNRIQGFSYPILGASISTRGVVGKRHVC